MGIITITRQTLYNKKTGLIYAVAQANSEKSAKSEFGREKRYTVRAVAEEISPPSFTVKRGISYGDNKSDLFNDSGLGCQLYGF